MRSHSDALIVAIRRHAVVMMRGAMAWMVCRSSGSGFGCTGRRMAKIVDAVEEGRKTSSTALLMSYLMEGDFRRSMEDA